MRRYEGWGWYPKPAKQPPPEHGIKMKKAGVTWWGQRWIEALEKLSWNYSSRLARGRTYARAGRVHDLAVKGGAVSARVTGSRPRPYKVSLRVAALSEEHWEKAIAQMARQAVFAAELLAGEMPEEIDQAFRSARVSLFPAQAADLRTECSCPDWANPCKHVAATHYVLGEAFDKDPFLLFELRGRRKEQVLGALNRARSRHGGAAAAIGVVEPESPGLAVSAVSLEEVAPGDYERLRGPTDGIPFRFEPPAIPAALIRQLGAPLSWSLEESALELFAPLYQATGKLARELALSSQATDPTAADA